LPIPIWRAGGVAQSKQDVAIPPDPHRTRGYALEQRVGGNCGGTSRQDSRRLRCPCDDVRKIEGHQPLRSRFCGSIRSCAPASSRSRSPCEVGNRRRSPPTIEPLRRGRSCAVRLFPRLHPGRERFRSLGQSGDVPFIQLAVEAKPEEPVILPPDHGRPAQRSTIQDDRRSGRKFDRAA